jgi:hypothetical protein
MAYERQARKQNIVKLFICYEALILHFLKKCELSWLISLFLKWYTCTGLCALRVRLYLVHSRRIHNTQYYSVLLTQSLQMSKLD